MHIQQSVPATQPEHQEAQTGGGDENSALPATTALNNNSVKRIKAIPPGVDIHLDKEEVILFFKLNNTLLHGKLDPDSELYERDFPEPVYVSKRKPVWILSELATWQNTLKAKRKLGLIPTNDASNDGAIS